MRLFLFSVSLALSTIFLTSSAFAAETPPPGCTPLYNGGLVCSNSSVLSINKKISNPTITVQSNKSLQDTDFTENIEPTATSYKANSLIAFRIYITNTSRMNLKKIVVKDVFPSQYLRYVSGSGSYDTSNHTFSTVIEELKPKDTKTVTILAMTAKENELLKSTAPYCTINIAYATVNNKISQDASHICITAANPSPAPLSSNPMTPTSKGGLPIGSPITSQYGQITPDTGPETIIIVGFVISFALGFFLRRKSFSQI